MSRNQSRISASSGIIALLAIANVVLLREVYLSGESWLVLLVALPLLLLAIYNRIQKKHAVLRNYPVIGYFRYLSEKVRPELRQYFFESDLDGRPFNRRQRSIVYQRAKNEKQTVAFGMQADPGQPGFEWLAHSLYPTTVQEKDLRVWIGNHQCSQPYHASILNIGAMSYGALSKTAVESLNEGARMGGFAHNTGEGGISNYHLMGGDLIWQIGTGYFGCRDLEGNFSDDLFRENALKPQVKMIELKLSQGAKPGHGGLLPASKNTEEIAAIRNVQPNTTVASPPAHSAFSNPQELLWFIARLRKLSDGKPVGFKLCIGNTKEFREICRAMITTGILPDFITIDGAEGGTGAAPLEFTDHLGMPLHDALAFASRTLEEFDLKDGIRVLASGRLITGFDILKTLSLGADAVYSARGMMFALGCVQALQCDSGKCPAGVATQDPKLYKGIDITDKKQRVANFHGNTIKAVVELMEACGFKTISEVTADKFFRKTDALTTRSFADIYKLHETAIANSKHSLLN